MEGPGEGEDGKNANTVESLILGTGRGKTRGIAIHSSQHQGIKGKN